MAIDLGSPVFVVGNVRSGTSLFLYLLNQNSQTALMYEADFFVRSRFERPIRSERALRTWFETWNQVFSRHGMSLEGGHRRFHSLEAFVVSVYKEYAERNNAKVMGEKSPVYTDCLVPIHRLLPRARFVVLWRDPRAIYSSVLRAAKQNRWFDTPGRASQLLVAHEMLLRQVTALRAAGVAVHEVRFEDLVTDPEHVLRATCEYLAVPFEEPMLDLAQADLSSLPTGVHHDSVRSRRIMTGRAECPDLPDRTAGQIDAYLARWKQLYGGTLGCQYELPKSTPPLSVHELLRHRVLHELMTARGCVVRSLYSYLPRRVVERVRESRNAGWARMRAVAAESGDHSPRTGRHSSNESSM
jgi:hypothetical protein